MKFKEAYEALKQGAMIKRPHWRGFWKKENGTITMHCKDGTVINFMDTDNIFVDIDNMIADDWIIIDDSEVKELNISTFTFCEAISNLKRGKRVARKGWNGKDMYLKLIMPGNAMCDGYDMQPCIGMKTAQNVMQPGWLASQLDILADDWILVEGNREI